MADEIKAFAEHLKPYPFLKNCYPFFNAKGIIIENICAGLNLQGFLSQVLSPIRRKFVLGDNLLYIK